MKTKILLVQLFFFGLFFNSYSEVTRNQSDAKKVNVKELEYKDGLYYLQDQLYSGLLYNIFSSKGPNNELNDSYFEGELVNGARQGNWVWYRNNEMRHKQIYENGILISDEIVINDKAVVLKN
tara:strand:- start:162 stop:530 length:369 start_codon:yes stop_codon:yes gene_type:complete